MQAINVLCVTVSHGFRCHIIDSLELEGTIYDDLVQLPHNEQGRPQLDQAAQNLIQPPLERYRAPTTSLGNLFQCLTTLTVKDFFLISNLNIPSSSLKPFLLVLSQQYLLKSLSFSKLVPSP